VSKVYARLRRYGPGETARYSIMRVIDLVQEYAWDFRHRVNTRGMTLPAVEGGQGYKGSLPQLVHDALRHLPIQYEDYTFIDLGSGKGRTLMMASEYPFRRIIGVEFVRELNDAALANLASYRSPTRKCDALESICADVRSFRFPEGPLVLYLFNPFEESIMEVVMENLRQSLEAQPRPVVLVYLRPLCAAALESAPFLQKMAAHDSRLIQNYNYSIYRNHLAPERVPVA
jgi:hypothetical protein